MTTPANLTYANIETRVANALKIPTSNTTEVAKVAALINEVYRDIYNLQDWEWLLKRAIINTTPRIDDTSAALTKNSTAVTFAAIPTQNSQNVSVAGFVVVVPGNSPDANAVYRIATHTGGTTIATLDAGYTGTTTTGTAIRLYQDSYALPVDCGKVLNVKRFGRKLPMDMIGMSRISGLKLYDQSEGKPEACAVFDHSTTGDTTTQRMLQVHPYPNEYYRMEIFYKQELNTELASTTQPFMPDEYRHILIYGALALGYVSYLNDSERGTYYRDKYTNALTIAANAVREYGADRSAIAPDMRGYRRTYPRRMRGRVSLGSFFDTLPNEP